MTACRWLLSPNDPELCRKFGLQLGIGALLTQCLLNRGLRSPSEIDRFLHPRLQELSDPFLLPDMLPAVERLFEARRRQERVILFGDYDVDGITSAALLLEVLRALGWQADVFLPNRFDEGYGLTPEGAAHCLRKFPGRLLVAVDCGSNAHDIIGQLKNNGIDTIVLDHHQLSEPPPPACALINPQRLPAGPASGRELASVGLAFKLAHALVKAGRQKGDPAAAQYDVRPLLDLVALGSIADLAPLRDENRILVRAGLERLNQTRRPGLQALKAVAGVPGRIGVEEVAFQLAPRLNAAGRLEDASAALELLLAADRAAADPLAARLDSRNAERRQLEKTIFDRVLELLEKRFVAAQDWIIVEADGLWHTGVIGIVASRILREFHRPTLIIGSEGKGSGRSLEGFDLAGALRQCGDLLLRHGGHAMAAGLTVKPGMIDSLRARLNELARRIMPPECLEPSVRIDAEIDLSSASFQEIAQLERLDPMGVGNPPPRLALRGVSQSAPARRLGKEEQHAKFWIRKEREAREIIWWNFGKQLLPDGLFDLVVTPRLSVYQGAKQIQLEGLHYRSALGYGVPPSGGGGSETR